MAKLPPVPTEVPASVPPDLEVTEVKFDEFGDPIIKGPAAYRVDEQKLEQMEAFAQALYDVKSPTYHKVMASFKLAVSEEAAKWSDEINKRRASKWTKHPVVRRARERILLTVDDGGPLSRAMYVRILLDREHKFSERGQLGDAAATVQLFKLIGATCGFTAKKPPAKVGTGPIGELPAGTTADDIAEGLIRAGERLKRLREPNPTSTRQLQLRPGEVAVPELKPTHKSDGVIANAIKTTEWALEEREFCVNHPQTIAHYQTWKTGNPLCIACLAAPPVVVSG